MYTIITIMEKSTILKMIGYCSMGLKILLQLYHFHQNVSHKDFENNGIVKSVIK